MEYTQWSTWCITVLFISVLFHNFAQASCCSGLLILLRKCMLARLNLASRFLSANGSVSEALHCDTGSVSVVWHMRW